MLPAMISLGDFAWDSVAQSIGVSKYTCLQRNAATIFEQNFLNLYRPIIIHTTYPASKMVQQIGLQQIKLYSSFIERRYVSEVYAVVVCLSASATR